jgi:hypothetical protein
MFPATATTTAAPTFHSLPFLMSIRGFRVQAFEFPPLLV